MPVGRPVRERGPLFLGDDSPKGGRMQDADLGSFQVRKANQMSNLGYVAGGGGGE